MMRLELIEAPDPILFEAHVLEEEHLRIGEPDSRERILLRQYLRAAFARLDGPNGLLGRALLLQKWTLLLPEFPHVITMPLPPLREIEKIEYLGTAGELAELDLSDVTIVGQHTEKPATILPLTGEKFPATQAVPGAVRITFVCGYGEHDDVDLPLPAPLRQAVLMDVAHFYQSREAVTLGITPDTLPMGYDSLVSAYRLWNF